MRRIVVIGSKGQIGSDLIREFSKPEGSEEKTNDPVRVSPSKSVHTTFTENVTILPLTHQDIEICNYSQTREILTHLRPDIVINTAAKHQVDSCEDHPIQAFETNALAARNIAQICNDLDSLFVHMSTDYVFGGDRNRKSPYTEDSKPSPINVYGVSKLAGEYLIRKECKRHLIIRSSGLYGLSGLNNKTRNFVVMMLELAKKGNPIQVVDDQRLAPSFTGHLARKLVELLATDSHGLFHITNQGNCSWYEFAKRIFELTGLSANLSSITSRDYSAKAARPTYSVLANKALSKVGLGQMPHWSKGLKDYFEKKHG